MSNAHQSFTDLDVWKSARKLKIRIWHLVKAFPTEENTDYAINLFDHLG